MAYTARKFSEAGADGLVVFNRFYQPDFDIENKLVSPTAVLSGPQDLRLCLTWIAILRGKLKVNLGGDRGGSARRGCAQGDHGGSRIAQLCSTLLRNGVPYIQTLLENIVKWMEENEYQSLQEMKGCMSQEHCEDPSAFERAHYLRTLAGYKSGADGFQGDEAEGSLSSGPVFKGGDRIGPPLFLGEASHPNHLLLLPGIDG